MCQVERHAKIKSTVIFPLCSSECVYWMRFLPFSLFFSPYLFIFLSTSFSFFRSIPVTFIHSLSLYKFIYIFFSLFPSPVIYIFPSFGLIPRNHLSIHLSKTIVISISVCNLLSLYLMFCFIHTAVSLTEQSQLFLFLFTFLRFLSSSPKQNV